MTAERSTADTHLLGYQQRNTGHVRRKPLPADSPLAKDKTVPIATVREYSNSTGTRITSKSSLSIHSVVPIWLSRPVLLCALILLTLLWIALLLLWHFNRVENGLELSLSSNHLAWTYGPTAVLVIIVNFWRQIDYSCKITQPWRVMSQGPNTASKTVMLDYLWPFQLTSLVDATRNGHFMVTCSIAGFMLLKIITLISTGLLVATDTLITQPALMRLNTSFDGTQFWSANPPTSPRSSNSSELPGYTISYESEAYSNFSGNIYHDFFLGLNNQITTPIGFHENLAFQSFSLIESYGKLVSRTGVVDVFIPNVTCEAAQLTYMQVPPNASTSEPYSGYSLRSQSCPSFEGNGNALLNASLGVYRGMTEASTILDNYVCSDSSSDDCMNITPSTMYDFWRINCSAPFGPQYAVDDRKSILNGQTSDDLRIAMATLNMSFHPYVWTSTGNTTSYKYQVAVDNYSAFVCQIGYTIQEANVTVTGDRSYSFTISENPATARHLDNLTDPELSEAVYDLYQRTGIASHDFQPLLNILNSTTTYYNGTTFDAYNLEGPLVRSLRGMAAMFMLQAYSGPSTAVAQGNVDRMEARLHVDTTVIFAMVACLIVMCVMTICLAIAPNPAILPRSHDTVAGNTAILASSRRLQNILLSVGLTSRKDTLKQLEMCKFRTVEGQRIMIDVSCPSGKMSTSVSHQRSRPKPWTPLSVRHYMVSIMLILPIASIGVLEALAQISAKQNGVATTRGEATSETYITRYLSTTVIFIIATLFNNFDFTIAVLAPFSALASGRWHARYGLRMNLLGKIPPHAFYQSIVYRQFGSTLSIVAGTIGSILTIAVSGLWIVSSVQNSQNAQVNRLSSWSVDWNLSRSDNGAFSKFNAIQHALQASSHSIWNDVVLPDLGSGPKLIKNGMLSDLTDTSSSNFTFVVSSLRPVLSCDIVPPEQIDVQYEARTDSNLSFFTISARAELSQECKNSLPATSNQTSVNFTSSYDTFPSGSGWYGQLMDLYIGFEVDGSQSSGPPPFTSIDPILDNPPGCPSLAVLFGFGHEVNNEQQLLADATALVCYQRLQQLNVSVTYLGAPSDNSLSTGNPPVTQEATVVYIKDPSTGANPSTLRFARETESLDYFPLGNGTLNDNRFFNNIMWGPDAPAVEDLMGPAGRQNLANAIDRLYRKYMVQVIDLNFRKPRNESGVANVIEPDTSEVPGTVQTWIYRLRIDNTSKLILQIMLAVMVLLGAFANAMMDVRGVLPKNPCSIARTMTLLAGSRLVEEEHLREEGQSLLDTHHERLAGSAYSLGWWTSETQLSTTPLILESVEGDDSNNEASSKVESEAEIGNNMRFGIDMETAEVLGFAIRDSHIKRWRDSFLSLKKRRRI